MLAVDGLYSLNFEHFSGKIVPGLITNHPLIDA
jgi:hypothetical protein